MDDPWFRRWFGFSYLPIKWQGWATIAVCLAIELPLMIVSLNLEPETIWWWCEAVLAFGIFLAFWAFIHLKTAQD